MKKLITLIVASVLSFNVAAGMVVIGNNAGVNELSKSDVKKLFMGKKSKLDNGQNAQIIELVDGSDGKLAFHDVATGRSESQLKSGWSRLVFSGKAEAPIQVADYSAVIGEVSGKTNAIGYIDDSALTADVKVLFKF